MQENETNGGTAVEERVGDGKGNEEKVAVICGHGGREGTEVRQAQ